MKYSEYITTTCSRVRHYCQGLLIPFLTEGLLLPWTPLRMLTEPFLTGGILDPLGGHNEDINPTHNYWGSIPIPQNPS